MPKSTVAIFFVVAALGFQATSARATPPPPPQQAAAEELCRTLYSPARHEKSLDEGTAMLIANLAQAGVPVPTDKTAAVRKAVGAATSYDEMVKQTATLIAAKFSLAELRDMIAFYKTPAGQHAMQLPSVLNDSGVQLGKIIAQRVTPKLRDLGLKLPGDAAK